MKRDYLPSKLRCGESGVASPRMDYWRWKLWRPEMLPMKRKRQPRVIEAKKWTICLNATNLYRVWLWKSRHPKGCTAKHNTSIDVTPQRVSVRHMDFGTIISNFLKVTTLEFGHLISIRAQLQDLRSIVGPFLQSGLEVLHFHTTVWMDKQSGRPPSNIWPNKTKANWLIRPYTDTTWLRLNLPSCIYTPINV